MNKEEMFIKILEAIDKYDYELSIQKEINETVESDLGTVDGCHTIIKMLLGFIEQIEDEKTDIEWRSEEMLIELAEYRGVS